MAKYVKKPVQVEAVQYTGDNLDEIKEFVGGFIFKDEPLQIGTLEGVMTVSVGDYVIEGVNGEFYPCKPDIFKKTYDAV